jgi:hypothetical protein
MQDQPTISPVAPQMTAASFEKFLLPLAILLGLVLRLYQASTTYLNPDEVWILGLAWPHDWAIATLKDAHPPYLFLLLHYLQAVNHSEWFLRLPSVLSGTFFPWVVYLWLRQKQFAMAAWAAFLILEFSPNLISLTAQVRGYALALFFSSLALYFLDRALHKRSVLSLGFFALAVYNAIFCEFSVAFAVTALGIYALLHLLSQPYNWRFRLLWAGTQLGTLALYFYLYSIQISGLLKEKRILSYSTEYLLRCFPQPGQSRLRFAGVAVLQQFLYLGSSFWAGIALVALFFLGLAIMGRLGPASASQAKLWPLGVSVISALGLALFAALNMIHPLGPTRHNIILTLFIVIPVALAIQWICSRFPQLHFAALPALFAGALLLFALAVPDPQNVSASRSSLPSMREAIQQIEEQIPKGSIVLMDEETAWVLSYYLERKPDLVLKAGTSSKLRHYRFDSYRAYGLNWFFDSFDTINKDLATLRSLENIPASQPIYVLDTGFVQLPPDVWNARELSPSMLLLLPQ